MPRFDRSGRGRRQGSRPFGRGARGANPRGHGARYSPQDVRDALILLGDASWSDLIDHLRPRRHESRGLRQVVDAMVGSGEVVVSRGGSYRLADGGERVAGVVVRDAGGLRLRDDAGRVWGLDVRDALRPGDRLTGVAVGDTVSAVSAVEPSPEPVVGLLRVRPRAAYIESLDRYLSGRIDLVATPPGREGDVVEVELLAQADGGLAGRVVGLVEAGNEAERAGEAMLRAHGIPRRWSFDPLALKVPSTVAARDIVRRRDLRDVPLVTIDGADARDFDDAVFAAPRAGGGWRLLVAIADVAHYVAPGSALDQDARERGNSVYLPDRVVPMLPEALSNGICSLRPSEDRLAVACDLRISAAGRLSGYGFFDAVIRSQARLTYADVAGFLAGGRLDAPDAVIDSLRVLHDVYRALRARREERGALDFEAREASIVLQRGRPVAVRPVLRSDAHRLIEEAMIAANVAAARFLEARGGDVPTVYRVHESPSGDKLDALEAALLVVGERLPRAMLAPKALAEVCERVIGKSSWPRWVWEMILLRSLPQAHYETRRLGHFGLALPTYLHFTSPIRRYADLLVHRAIKGHAVAAQTVDAVAAHISATERRAEDAERAVDAWLKCALLEERIGETFRGIVAGVTGFGLFVELEGMFVQGLVHVSKLGRDYYRFAPETMSLVADRSGARFTLADRVEVVVEDVSVATGRIDLGLVRRQRRAAKTGA